MEVLNFKSRNNIRFRAQELPLVNVNAANTRPSLSIATYSQEPKLRKGTSVNDPIFES